MKNTLTTNKLECFIIHIIFIDLLSVLHIPGIEAVPKVRFDIQTLCLPGTSEHFLRKLYHPSNHFILILIHIIFLLHQLFQPFIYFTSILLL